MTGEALIDKTGKSRVSFGRQQAGFSSRGGILAELHCQHCGGFIGMRRYVSYPRPEMLMTLAEPSPAACLCTVPVIYGPPPGHNSQTMPVMRRTTSPTRNPCVSAW